MRKLATAVTALALLSAGIGNTLVATPSLATSSLGAALSSCAPPPRYDWSWGKVRLSSKLAGMHITYESIDTFATCYIVRTRDGDGGVENQFYDPLTLHRVY